MCKYEAMTVKFDEFCEANDIEPFLAITWACRELGWSILVEDSEDDAVVNGLAIGTDEWLNEQVTEGGSVNLGNQ